jgi:septal ring factor EnvC (AmiA/AmiB activator)
MFPQMAEYQDLGQYIMKLFDDLIADSKNKINEARENFIRELPRKLSSRMTVSSMMVEGLIRDMSDQLLRINQDCLNEYSISIAKKARSANKKRSKAIETEFVENKELLERRQEEIEGLQAQNRAIEKKNQIIEQEKEEIRQNLSEMNSRIQELEKLLATANEEFENQITQLNTDWETKFRQNQEEWDSYVKLKIAEKEVRASTESTEAHEAVKAIKTIEAIDSAEAPKPKDEHEENSV